VDLTQVPEEMQTSKTELQEALDKDVKVMNLTRSEATELE